MPGPSPTGGVNNPYRLRSGRPRLRRELTAATGLVGAWAWPGGYGQDLVGSNHLSPGGAVTYDGVRGLRTESAGLDYQCAIDAALKLQPPLTIVWQGSTPTSGSRTANAVFFGVSYTNADTSPFSAYQLAVDSFGSTILNKNQAGTFGQLSFVGSTPIAGANLWLAAVLQAGNSFTYIGDPALNGSTGAAVTSINYGATPLLSFGTPSYVSRNSLCSSDYGLIYNHALTLKQLQWLYARGRDLFARKRDWGGWVAAFDASLALIFNVTGSGGLVLGETIGQPSIGFTATGTGGAVLGETIGQPRIDFFPIAAGGAVLGETIDQPSISFTASASGGAVLGETVDQPSISFTASPSGGAIVGETLNPSFAATAASSGGAVLGETVSPETIFTAIASGGAVLGETLSPTIDFSPAPSGGALLGSHLAPSANFAASSSGGAVLGSTAAAAPIFVGASSGGLVLGETIVPVIGFTAVSTGGAVLGETVDQPSIATTVAGTGGVVLGQTTSFEATFGITGGGGPVLASQLNPPTPSVVFMVTGAGGVLLGETLQALFGFPVGKPAADPYLAWLVPVEGTAPFGAVDPYYTHALASDQRAGVSGAGQGGIITKGLGGPLLITKGYGLGTVTTASAWAPAADPRQGYGIDIASSSVSVATGGGIITKGLGGPLLLTKGYGLGGGVTIAGAWPPQTVTSRPVGESN